MRLDARTRDLVEDPADAVMFSAASIQEIAIESALGRRDFAIRPEAVTQAARATGLPSCRCWPTWQPVSPICPRITVIRSTGCSWRRR